MIDIQKIKFGYKDNSPKVFEDFSLRLEQNNVYGLLGENGWHQCELPQTANLAADVHRP